MALQPHPFLSDIARQLLEKADRSKGEANVRLKLTRANAPTLFAAADAESLKVFELLLGELAQTGWVRLHLRKLRDFQSFTEREPALELLDFTSLAQWAKYQSRHEAWDWLLVAYLRSGEVRSRFGERAAALADYLARSPMGALEPLGLAGAASVLERLHEACLSGERIPLRQLSASIFQGRSKVLDSRTELLRVLGAGAQQFPEAPIQLLACVPAKMKEVIFVENLLTFESMSEVQRPAWAGSLLLYAAGFRGGARRLLEPGGAVVYTREGASANAGHVARSALAKPASVPVYFFGDLDFAGMDILRNLRQVFPDAQAWRPGYELLLELLHAGGSHMPVWADKDGQVDPEMTGCPWADSVLLSAIRKSGRFVDQEAVTWPT